MPTLRYREFLKKAEKVLTRCRADKQLLAVIVIDFEGLSELDSVLGYAAVDAILYEVGVRVSGALHENDLVGYIGRHQVGCILPMLPTRGHAELAGHKLLRVLSEPFQQSDRQVLLVTRIGISLMNHHDYVLGELLRQAFSSIRSATNERELIKVYSHDIDELIMLELDLMIDLERAVEESRVFLVYQPQLRVNTNQIIGSEALLRWTHPTRGPIGPESMIRVAERTALISKLTFWVFNTAMRHCAEMQEAGLDLGVSVNFSAHNLREPDLADIVQETVEIWNIPATKIQIELTETAIMEEHKRSITTLTRFKEMGFRIAMDDFGTGYSSMALLGKLPIDEVKIDISFIRDMLKKPEQDRIVASMIDLAHALHMSVVAEGVENLATFERLRELGCDIIQGYFVGHPMPLGQFITNMQLLKNGQ